MGRFAGVLAIGAGAMALVAWILMLIIGAVHADWLPAVPTIGYRTALLICSLMWAQQMIRGLAILWVKHLNAAKPEPKPAPAQRVSFQRVTPPPPDGAQRLHWVDPERWANQNLPRRRNGWTP